MPAKKKTTTKKKIKVPKDFYKDDVLEIEVPKLTPEQINPGAASMPKPGYNKHGVCLACNGNNPECTHNSLTEGEGGKIICTICGTVIN